MSDVKHVTNTPSPSDEVSVVDEKQLQKLWIGRCFLVGVVFIGLLMAGGNGESYDRLKNLSVTAWSTFVLGLWFGLEFSDPRNNRPKLKGLVALILGISVGASFFLLPMVVASILE